MPIVLDLHGNEVLTCPFVDKPVDAWCERCPWFAGFRESRYGPGYCCAAPRN